MSDNELDNLFKEAAEGFAPPQDKEAWTQMASLLDQHGAPVVGFWNWKTISGIASIGLIALTGTWYVSTNNRQAPIPGQEIASVQPNKSNTSIQDVVQEHQKQLHSEGLRMKTEADDGNATGNDLNVISGKADSEITDNPITTDEEKEIVQEQHSELDRIPDQQPVTDSVQTETEEKKVEVIGGVTEKNAQDKTSRTGSGLSLKAVVSPDFSSVKFFSASKPGINYGLLAGYSFNSRWSVYTGVIYSKKLYTSTEVEGSYNWDGHDYPIKELEGDCRIFDIPINVYYTFFPERNFSIRAGLGFSSYIMQKEDYIYCVDNYGNDIYYSQQVRGENNEWFKVMNLSIAISRRLSPRLSAEFEPFVKAPVAGVGEGKVSLVSMGAFINMKFDLTQRK